MARSSFSRLSQGAGRHRRRLHAGLALWLGPAAALGAVLGLLVYTRLQPPDPRRLAERARPLSAVAVDRAMEGQVVAVTGTLRAEALLGDPGLLRPGDYVELWRDVEVFAWHEIPVGQHSYRYEPRWGSDPPPTAEFLRPDGHDNPPVSLRSEVLSAPRAWVGAYRFSPARARLLASSLPLVPEMLEDRRHRIAGGVLYIGTGTEHAPHLGDVRVSYRAVRAGEVVTLLGEQRGEEIVPAYDHSGARLYHLVPGPLSEARRGLPKLASLKPLLLR